MSEERKSENLYVIHEGKILQEVGYECPPNDDYFWFPTIGWSVHLGSSCFRTYEEAKEKARIIWAKEIDNLDLEIVKLQKALREL